MKLPANYTLLLPSQRRRVREAYIAKQKGKCWHCGEPLSQPAPKRIRDMPLNINHFPTGFFIYPVHLHHDHNTNLTVGAVHCHCNAVLWQYHNQ